MSISWRKAFGTRTAKYINPFRHTHLWYTCKLGIKNVRSAEGARDIFGSFSRLLCGGILKLMFYLHSTFLLYYFVSERTAEPFLQMPRPSKKSGRGGKKFQGEGSASSKGGPKRPKLQQYDDDDEDGGGSTMIKAVRKYDKDALENYEYEVRLSSSITPSRLPWDPLDSFHLQGAPLTFLLYCSCSFTLTLFLLCS